MTALEREMAADAIAQLCDAEARWNTLREYVRTERAIMYDQALDYDGLGNSEMAARGFGATSALDRVLAMMDRAVLPVRKEGRTMTETTHQCPPSGSGVMPCCGLTPFEAPRTDRMTLDPALVTCGAPSVSGTEEGN